MKTEVRIDADSISRYGARITTFVLRYPRIIHDQLMTHRAFSRSAMSFRAIPIRKLIERATYVPEAFGSAKRGMVSGPEIEDAKAARAVWVEAQRNAVKSVELLEELGVHKEVANYLLFPFSYIDVVVTATDWKNFWALRCHPHAHPAMRELAEAMRVAYEASEPMILSVHAPLSLDGSAESSAAGCARVSYAAHEGERTIEKDRELAARLWADRHLSPFEHYAYVRADGRRHANFQGWQSERNFREQTESI